MARSTDQTDAPRNIHFEVDGELYRDVRVAVAESGENMKEWCTEAVRRKLERAKKKASPRGGA